MKLNIVKHNQTIIFSNLLKIENKHVNQTSQNQIYSLNELTVNEYLTFVRQNTKDVHQNIVILAEVPFLFSVRLRWSRPVSRGPCDHEIEVRDHFRWEPLRRRVGKGGKLHEKHENIMLNNVIYVNIRNLTDRPRPNDEAV